MGSFNGKTGQFIKANILTARKMDWVGLNIPTEMNILVPGSIQKDMAKGCIFMLRLERQSLVIMKTTRESEMLDLIGKHNILALC